MWSLSSLIQNRRKRNDDLLAAKCRIRVGADRHNPPFCSMPCWLGRLESAKIGHAVSPRSHLGVIALESNGNHIQSLGAFSLTHQEQHPMNLSKELYDFGGIPADQEVVKEIPQNRASAPSKLRRDKKHCPVCLAPLQKNARRTKLMKECTACGAHVQASKICAKCSRETIWQGKRGAACQACGFHGSATSVVVSESTRR